MKKIEKVLFVSVWDEGFEVSSKAKLNKETGEIFDFEENDISEEEEEFELETLDEQYVLFKNRKYEVLEDENGMNYSIQL